MSATYQWSTLRLYGFEQGAQNVCSATPATFIGRQYGPRCSSGPCLPYVNDPISFQCRNSDLFGEGDEPNGGGFFDTVAVRNRIRYFVFTEYADAACSLFSPNIQTSSNKEGNLRAIRADGTCIAVPRSVGPHAVPSPPGPPKPTSTSTRGAALPNTTPEVMAYFKVICPDRPADRPMLADQPGLEDLGGVMTLQRCTESDCDPTSCEPVATYPLTPRRQCLPDAILGSLERGFVVGECRVAGEGRDLLSVPGASSSSATPSPTATASKGSSTNPAWAWTPSVMVVAGRPRFDADAVVAGTLTTQSVLATTTARATGSQAASETGSATSTVTQTRKSGAEVTRGSGALGLFVSALAGLFVVGAALA
ncbi:hypothetical protein HDU96_001386 [Phlyctochytrium bullatum]|nr:hypothetical protein HDU96_001386 [Phlyctochytrium bullatum]